MTGSEGAAAQPRDERPPILLRVVRDLFAGRAIGAGAAGAVRASAQTEATFTELLAVVRETAAGGGRSLVIVDGVACSGRTVLGLRLVHALRGEAPAVYLSGNATLAEVLQYDLRALDSGSGAPVRSLKDFVRQYAGKQAWVPPQHVIVVDDVQPLAPDEQVAAKHGVRPARSDPDTLIGVAGRVPGWSVLVVVTGDQGAAVAGDTDGAPAAEVVAEGDRWRAAAGRSRAAAAWVVHEVSLDTPLRNAQWPQRSLRVFRDIDAARQALRARQVCDQEARFGLLASSRDQDLVGHGVANDPSLTGRPGLLGPWYCDGEESRRCGRHLEHVVTEFGVRGLELDAALVAWGSDLAMVGGVWTNARARDYARSARVKDPLRLRRNAYRLLLSRGLDETVVFVPPLALLDETAAWLAETGPADL